MSEGPKFLNQKKAAARLGVSVASFVKYHRRHLPAKGGKRPVYSVDLLDAYASSPDGLKAAKAAPDDAGFWLRKMRERDG
jgi:hypothetical protein